VSTSGFDFEAPAEDDYAGMLAELESRLDRSTIANAIGVRESELELVSVGHAPPGNAAERLKMLYDLAQRAEKGDLSDPRTLLEAEGVPTTEGQVTIPLSLVPRMKTFFIGFLVFDALVFGGIVLFVALRS
jgi:hypothetical protein